jgi:hypothetical protein
MAVTGWKTPGTCESVDRDGKEAWANPDYAKTSDNNNAVCGLPKTDYGDWLRLTNFGFAVGDIPSGSTIDGIEVKIEHRAGGANSIKDSALYLRKTSGQIGDNKASATYWGTSDAEVTYGSSTDKWNASLVGTDIISTDFGIDLSGYNASTEDAVDALIDCISIRVYYTEGAFIPCQNYYPKILAH